MESKDNSGESFKVVELESLLSKKEINHIKSLILKGDFKGAKQYLNETDRKEMLLSKGVFPDFLYYILELKYTALASKLN